MTVGVTMWSRAHGSACCLEPSVRSVHFELSRANTSPLFISIPSHKTSKYIKRFVVNQKTKYLRYLFCNNVVGPEEFLAANPPQNNLTFKNKPRILNGVFLQSWN